jgi:phosphomannomutase
MVKHKKEFSGKTETIFKAVRKKFPDAEVNTDDGLRLSFGTGWVHLRTSNTEPIIRVIAEAQSLEEAEKLANACMEKIG